MVRLRPVRSLVLYALLLAGLADASPAQSTLESSPNLSGLWVGLPWMLQFRVLQRYNDVDPDGTDFASLPTVAFALGLPGRALVGARYAAASPVAPGEPDEVELFGRYQPIEQARGAPVDATLQAGFNTSAETVDGELGLARWLGPLRLLAAARGFSNGFGADEARFALAGGAVLHVMPGRVPIALAGDVASLFDREAREEIAWSAALQVGMSFTPNTLSLQVTNASSGTLEGRSQGLDEVRLGFEITLPIPAGTFFGLYAPRAVALEAVEPAPAPPPGRIVTVPIRRYAFLPGRIEVPAGTTVEWTNYDQVVHTATADDASWNSGAIPTGGTWSATFDAPGIYPYHCGPHPFMRGVVVVR